MKLKFINRIWLIFLGCCCLCQCRSDACKHVAPEWKNNALSTLKEFQAVDAEIKENDKVFARERVDDNSLYIRTDFPEQYEKKYSLKLPKLKQWFSNKDWGHISYKEEAINILYKTCNQGTLSYKAWLYFSKSGIRPTFTKNLVAEIADSLDLGNGWYYIMTKCDGCGG